MAHELSSENLRRVVPGGLKQSCAHSRWMDLGIFGDERSRWSLSLGPLRNGSREIEIQCIAGIHAWPHTSWLPLGTISTVAELKDWYQRLGGKGWE